MTDAPPSIIRLDPLTAFTIDERDMVWSGKDDSQYQGYSSGDCNK